MRQFLDSNDLASEARMARSLDSRAVLVVEGATDARFFERFVDHEHCYVLAAHDRQRAVAVLRLLNSGQFPGVLAIIDADFGRITETLETESNILFCDGHDLEMMLIRSKSFERVVGEHCSATKLSVLLATRKPEMLLSTLLAQVCQPLGAFLLVSLRGDLGLKFEDLTYKDFVEIKSLVINLPDLIRSVMNKSSRHDSPLAAKLEQQIQAELNLAPQIWDMSRGHDCVEMLSYAIRNTIGTKKSKTDDRKPTPVNAELLERELRLAFSEVDFSSTILFSEIQGWESANGEYRMLLRV